MQHSVPDPEAWVYEHAVKNGKPAFPYTHLMIWQRPVRDFITKKLGCMSSIGYRDSQSRPDEKGLDNELMLQIVGGGTSPRMGYVDDRYLIGLGHMWGDTFSKGLMVLDMKRRRAAFAVTEIGNFWASKNNDVVNNRYSDRRIALFLVDDDSQEFLDKVLGFIRRWKTEWNIENHARNFPHLSTLPVDVYAFRCDRPR